MRVLSCAQFWALAIMKRIALFLFTLLGSASFFAVVPGTLAAEVDDNVVWIDVRSGQEYRRGHIEGAINIPHGDIGHRIFVEVPDTFKEVHIYDGSQGTFAGIALEILMEIGFQEVVNEGGYEALLEKQGISEE
ncbi:MAG: MerR family transcriptional regulator [SAR86 cluster bacterium]|uniref:MerR family transcriptional regulator n=1 Tax=SAR86 cluster bacterium TaxID=2030880 RepID=A0A2A4X7L6_9GAMM|nr:MAG: MerR family transcriptional regulator [SAR86 cluster bacterium]